MANSEVWKKQAELKKLCLHWVRDNHPEQYEAFRHEAGMLKRLEDTSSPVRRKRKYTRHASAPSYTEIMDKLHA